MANKKLQNSSSASGAIPVVSVLGHVDHGKTTLLDAIRKTDIAQKEHGGITQKIGASSIEIIHEGKKRRITFIDTPGHEAFAKMRGRGAKVADIGLLIVSQVDGVMPQTKESIKLLLLAKIPLIVVLTKSDLPGKHLEKIKQQLVKEGVLLEGYGGDVSYLSVSAKTNSNIKELLELILLVFDMRKENQSLSKTNPFSGVVIESRLDPKAGPKATVVVKDGSISVRDEIICDNIAGRVRTIIDDQGRYLDRATIGEAVEILGFEKVPRVGAMVFKKTDELTRSPVGSPSTSVTPLSNQTQEEAILSIILCADNLGSLEAITNALPKEIKSILQKTGEISPADVLLAKSTKAIILGFNTRINPQISKLALQEKVLVKNYRIIYELIDEVKEVLRGKQLKLEEEIFGEAQVLASFPFEKTKVLGIKVLKGRVVRGDKVRLTRRNEEIGESVIFSIRIGKNPVSKIEQGSEAGVILSPFLDFSIGDMLICHG